ncbi:hypothetical protein TSUD_213820 [Trifolium subterraneum]|uniref:Uncharacterized protein n=1 Tax=Trifolium subterraneum TaxID=3900 RepID=A0A2Z6MWA6_TRISU|nr:hypothetical protein TSUD_213820 [Trifolium subterraneum]
MDQGLIKEHLALDFKFSGFNVNLPKSRFLPSSNLTNAKVAKYVSIVEFHHTYNMFLCRKWGCKQTSVCGQTDRSLRQFIRVASLANGWIGKQTLRNKAGLGSFSSILEPPIFRFLLRMFGT